MSLSEILRNIFFFLLIAQFAPTAIKSIKTQYSGFLEPKTKVALIPIKGAISSSETYIKNLKKYFEDKEIKAIVLQVECPGGVSGSSQDIFYEILHLKNKHNKKVIAFVENMAASGGYYILCATDWSIATPSAFIGSIGSYIGFPLFKKLAEQYNVRYEIIKSGEYKTAGNPLADLTEQQKQMLQKLSDSVYEQFINDVATQRKALPKNAKEWADGKVFTGEQALKLGLIDEIGSHSTVIEALKEKAGIEGKIEWVKPLKSTSMIHNLIYGEDSEGSEFKTLVSKLYSIINKDDLTEQAQINF